MPMPSMNEVLNTVESFCSGMITGCGQSITLLLGLVLSIFRKEEPKPAVEPPQPQPQSEMARRRAQRRKEEGLEPERLSQQQAPSVTQCLRRLLLKNFLLCVVCVLGMTHVFMPFVQYLFEDSWNSVMETVIGSVIFSVWLGPLWLISKIVNIFWMNQLATDAYQFRRGRPAPVDLSFFVSDFIYTCILQMFFILQIVAVSMINIQVAGINPFELILTAISYSLYAFEYKWMYMGFNIRKRLDLVERNVGYHIGFGLPLTGAVLMFTNFWMRFIVYSLLFPVLILAANEAKEPAQRKSGSCYVFYISDKLTGYSLRTVSRLTEMFGLRMALLILLSAVGIVWLYLSGVVSLWYIVQVPCRALCVQIINLCQLVLSWLQGSS